MSKQIDERVVSMKFDNKHFESNVQTTLGTLDKLKQGLRLQGATKGLEDVNAASKKVDMTHLGSAVESVQTKFSALQVMAVTALANITNSAVNAGKRMVSALTIDPIKTGFSEYETQINAVQTILANTESKGTTLQQVNSALDTLNTYADKTIYNFTEMTKNIGTFTAAGVDLDTSVQAIQGIANLAAVSGSTSQQASTAMYQLSQALSSGTVKLMDWNSVVNAGMGGQVFQDALKETARNHGVAIDQMIKDQGSFRETLQEGWLTADILTETLSHFTMAAEEGTEEWEAYKKSLMDDGYTAKQAEEIIKLSNTATNAATKVKTFTQLWDTLKESAQSGWTQTWEIIVGDFEEAKGFLTDISDKIGGMIGAANDARNEVLNEGLASGWKQLLGAGIADEAGFKDTFQSVAKEHNVSIEDMIKAEKALDSSLSDSQAYQKALTKGLKEGTLNSDMLSESVHKMADKMSKMSGEQLQAAGYTQEHVTQIKKLSKGLKEGEISMDDFVKKMTRTSGRENIIQALWNAFEGLMSVVEPIKQAFGEIFDPITGEQLYSFTEALVKFTEKLTITGSTADKLKRTFKGVFAIFDIAVEIIKAITKGFVDMVGYISPAGGEILDFTANLGDFLVGLRDAIKSSNAFGKVFEYIGKFLKPIVEGVVAFGKAISDVFINIADTAEVRFEPLTALANFIKGIFTGLASLIGRIFPWISKLASAIGGVLSRLMDRITNAIQSADFNVMSDIFNTGIIAAVATGIMKFIKQAKSTLDDFDGFLESLQDILDGVKESINAFAQSIKIKNLKTIAISIGILAASLVAISLIDSDKLGASLGAVAVLFGELMASMSIFAKMLDGKDFKSIFKMQMLAKVMRGLATALVVLAIAMKIMSTMSWSEMGVALISLVVGLGALVTAVNMLPKGEVTKSAKTIKKLASALIVLAIALKIMSTMSWSEMGVALISAAVGLGMLVGAVRILPVDGGTKAAKTIKTLASALVILAIALKIMASMSWEELARGLLGAGLGLVALVGAVHLLPANMGGKALGMVALATAMVILGAALKIMGGMTWEEMARGLIALGGSLMILAGAMHLMKSAVAGAGAMVIMAAALITFVPALKSLGSMSLSEIGISLLALASAFIVMGVAAKLLKPLIGTLLKLSIVMAIFGAAVALLGVGIVAIATGLTALAGSAAAIAVAIVTIVSAIISLIPYIIEQIGVGIVKLLDVIAGAGKSIFGAIKTIIVSLMDALVACVPLIVDGVLVLIMSLLESLAKHTPKIVNYLFDFLVALIDGLAARVPDLIGSCVNFLMALLTGTIDALQNIDPEILVKGILAVKFMAAFMAALALIAGLAPLAVLGVIAFGVVVAELAIVLAAVGALAQLPGLSFLVGEGGNLLQKIGTAIGQFLGGIAGGFAKGASAALPKVAEDLSAFMQGAKPFIDGARSFDSSTLDGVKALVGVILALTGANIIEGLTSWFTGGSSLTKFGEELAMFAPNLKLYADTVKGIDGSAVEASANAAKTLTELARTVPNSGGVASWFAGENSIASFGTELVELGKGLKSYSDSIVGFNGEAVIASANAAKALTDLASTVPNEGGVAGWFAGENSIAKFGKDLVELGKGLKSYSDSIAGFNPEAVIASASAAKALAEMTQCIPNEGGVAAWFAGENSISKFSADLVELGKGLKSYSDTIVGFNPEAVIASANAAKALADMTSCIPNAGGVASWFAGENSISKFSTDLVLLGTGLFGFSMATAGINAESIIAAAKAAKALAQMTACIPNEGGIVSWFAGENSISKFSTDLVLLGKGLVGFSNAISEGDGINPEAMISAANGAKAIAAMVSCIPNEGGIVSWFSGESSVSKFGAELKELGSGLKSFSDSVSGDEGIDPEAVIAAAGAAKALAEMTTFIPTEGGIKAWFSGESGVASFAENLPTLGEGLRKFSTEITKDDGINPEAMTAAANAAKTLAEMTSFIPSEGGMKAWFSGEKSVANFADNLGPLGEGIKSFSDAISEGDGINTEQVTAASSAAKTLAQMTQTTPKDTDKLISFGKNLVTFGGNLKSYFTETSGIAADSVTASTKAISSMKSTLTGLDASKLTSASKAITQVVKSVEGMSKISESTVSGFSNAMKKLGKAGVDAVIKAFADSKTKLESAGKNAIQYVIDGANTKEKSAKDAFKAIISKCVTALSDKVSAFETAGKDLGKGLVKGINSKQQAAYDAGYRLGQQAVQGEKDGQKSNSPSKLTIMAGKWLGEGLIVGMDKMGNLVYKSGANLGQTATDTISSAISKVSDVINTDIDTEPTIRPVLDLSSVESGVSAIGGMFSGRRTLAIDTRTAGTVSAMMSGYQNGRDSSELLSAIKGLRKDFANTPHNVYTINGITYDDGSNINTAVESLVRAAKMERRI